MLSPTRNTLLATICILASAASYGADKPITVGLVLDGLTQADREPLRAYLSKELGRPVNLEAPDLYSETVARLANGSYDFACLNAVMYLKAHARYGVIPLVRRTADLQYHSVFITGTGSSIHALGDLKGKRFAFGDIDAASTRLIAYRELTQAGIQPKRDLQLRYSGSHVATAALVETGVVDAGVMDETIYNAMIADGKLDGKRVRVFFTSEPFISYVFVARKDVPVAEQEKFTNAFLALRVGKDDKVLKILRAKQFVVASDEEYTLFRKIAKEMKMF
jgi:phosphonate transport system substrate-binding protein